MKRSVQWSLSCVLVAACSGTGGSSDGGTSTTTLADGAVVVSGELPEFTSGSRLKARYIATPEGAKQFLDWTDTTLGTTCSFNVMSDGKEHCTPAQDTDGFASLYFTDAACTHAIAVTSGACSTGAPRYVTSYPLGRCGAEVRPVMSPGVAPPAQVFQRSGATCAAATLDATARAFPVGDAMAPSQFVAHTTRNGTGSGRLVATWDLAEDGSSARHGWYDTMLNTACVPATTASGAVRCMPDTPFFHYEGSWFGDAQCTQRAAIAFGSACSGAPATPTYATQTSQSCGITALFTAGAAVSPASAFTQSTPSMCTSAASVLVPQMSVGPEDTASLVLLGDRVADDRLAAFTIASTGTARIRRVVIASEAGAPSLGVGDNNNVRSATWYDAMLEIPCTMNVVDAHTRRCTPMDTAREYFTDAGCTAANRVLGNGNGMCAATAPRMVAVAGPTTSACVSAPTTYYRTGARVTSASVYSTGSGACGLVGTSDNVFFAPGEMVAESAFATVAVTQD